MTDWQPATEAEAALRDALRAGDQELYFRILSHVELLLPVSHDAQAGRAPVGWGTWTSGGRTHVLAFTSQQAMNSCLAEHGGAARRMPYADLAGAWPNHEWWLAINPGLPIEGYLPAWFVAQLSRGDVRLPGRTIGARARVEAAAAQARGEPVPMSAFAATAAARAAQARSTPQTGAHHAPDNPAPRSDSTGRARVPAHAAPEPEPEPRRLTAIPPRPTINSRTMAPPRTPAPPVSPPPAPVPPPGPSQQPAWNPPGPLPVRTPAEPPASFNPPAAPASDLPRRSRLGEGEVVEGEVVEATSATQPVPGRYRAYAEPVGRAYVSPVRYPDATPPAETRPVSEPRPMSEPRPVSEPHGARTETGRPMTATGRARPGGYADPTARSHPEPVTPAAPVDPARLVTPVEPTWPAAPVEPARPAAPVEPARPAAFASPPGTATEPDKAAAEPPADPDFTPANGVESELLAAAGDGQTDHFLSTLLLAKVLIPIPPNAPPSARPGEPGFAWRREQVDGQPYVVVFTSTERMTEYLGAATDVVEVKFVQLIRAWPDESWSFAVNPGTPVGASLPGVQIKALAAWAAEVGLTDQPAVEEETRPAAAGTAPAPPTRPVMMQKTITPTQVRYYLDRGYDRVSGFVQRASEVAHLTTPEQLYQALGLGYPDSPFQPDADEVYLLRWTAYRPNLYRIPFGGRDEQSMRAMQGWVIERPPFRGNGFAPGETNDVIAEFKVDSARLPHAAQMWRMRRGRKETLVALLDADGPRWRPVGPEHEVTEPD